MYICGFESRVFTTRNEDLSGVVSPFLEALSVMVLCLQLRLPQKICKKIQYMCDSLIVIITNETLAEYSRQVFHSLRL